jgi:hypothetical protein
VYATLTDILLEDGATARVTADCQALVEQELSAKSGVAATALKVAYKAVTAFAPGYYQTTVQNLVPELMKRLQPFWTDFQAAGGGQFGDYLAKRGDEVSEALLGVTDDMAEGSDRVAVVKAYRAVRGGAAKHIEAALPAVGALVEKYAA